jgi:hypothetical protein
VSPKQALAGVALALVVLLATAAPAGAHTGKVAATDYRSTITEAVAVPGGRLRIVEAGGRIELTSPRVTVVVLGYEGEPYLRVGPDGVEENRRSPASYLNASRTGGDEPPAGADAGAAPRWVRVSTSSTARWHDHRAHFMGGDPLEERVTPWEIDLVVDGSPRTLAGELVHVDGPSSVPWFAVALALAALVVAVGRRALLPALVAVVAVDVVRVAGVTFAVVDDRLAQAVDVGLVDAVAWALAGAALTRLVRGKADGVLAAGVVGLLLAITAGLLEWGDLAHSQLAVPTPALLHRACIAAAAGIGVGVAIAALREAARVPVRPAGSPPAR